MNRLHVIISIIRQNIWQWWLVVVGTVILYYCALLASLIIRFGNLPNYINTYDWWYNVVRIFQSTPSLRDSLMITLDEWLLEIGYMNYDFGIGISEWSLFIVPTKVLGIALLGALVATNYFLLKAQAACNSSHIVNKSSGAATGVGAALISIASVSLSWVVCCSTPTWVVGLAMLGLGASTALWLEPLGIWLNSIGFILLLLVCITSAGNLNSDSNRLERA